MYEPVKSLKALIDGLEAHPENEESNGVRNFSVGMAARFLQVFGTTQPKQHNQQLVALKVRATRADNSNVRRQEELQEWMENLEFRLNAVCQVSSDQFPPGTSESRPLSTMPDLSTVSLPGLLTSTATTNVAPFPSPTNAVPGAPSTSETTPTVTYAGPSSSVGSSASGSAASSKVSAGWSSSVQGSPPRHGIDGKVGRSKTAFSSTRLGRSRSEEKLIESVAAAVTDSRYLEELQFKQQKESISSLHERLTERKVKEEEPKPSIAVRSKSAVVPKKQQISRKKKKSTSSNPKSTSSPEKPSSVSCLSSPYRASTLSLYSLKESAISRRWPVRSRCEHYLERQWQQIQPGEHDTPP